MNKTIAITLITMLFCGWQNNSFADVSYSNQNKTRADSIDTNSIVFRDTLYNMATDSLTHDLGKISIRGTYTLLKYFKYIGTDTVSITRAWTSDPHYICKYPQEPLVSGKIYSMSVCFYFGGQQGQFQKVMGFNLSNGAVVSFRFSGTVVPEEKNEK